MCILIYTIVQCTFVHIDIEQKVANLNLAFSLYFRS